MEGLTKKEEEVLQLFKQRVLAAFPHAVVSIQLFGSKARGDAHKDSDIDVLVVLKDGNIADDRMIISLAASLFADTGVYISPKMYSQAVIKEKQSRHNMFLQSIVDDLVPL